MLIKKGTLILVADGAKAILYQNDGGVDAIALTVVWQEVLDNPATHQQGTDTPGRTQSSVGTGRSSYSETDLHQAAEDAFAKETAETLEEGLGQNPDSDLIIMAAPRLLGIIRNHYGRLTREQLVAEIDKDLTNMPKDQVEGFLSTHVAT
jgi:protein required for attachment to host cells